MGSWVEAFFTLLGYTSPAGTWRLWLCALITAVVVSLICALIPQPALQFLLCVPLGLAGVGIGIYWEINREPPPRRRA